MPKKKDDSLPQTPRLTANLDETHRPDQNTPEGIPALIVGIGASAGGLDALKGFFSVMPDDLGVCFIVVQHLDPHHKSMLVDLLGRQTKMSVKTVSKPVTLSPNQVYVIAPNQDLLVDGEQLLPVDLEREGKLHLPVDRLLQSLAENHGERAVGIILSGAGSDGSAGIRAIKGHGGMVMVQVPEEARCPNMPISAIGTGIPDFVLPVEEMPDVLARYSSTAYLKVSEASGLEEPELQYLHRILTALQAKLGHDFHQYKQNTLIRRIRRRMGLRQIEKMGDYVAFLNDYPAEIEELFKDLLIGVTNFFREPDSWDALQEKVLPNLFEQADEENPPRVWVPGCATGEEAYSLGMLLWEQAYASGRNISFQVFATDIDAHALQIARAGRYPKSIASDVSPERLKSFFTEEGDSYIVSSKLREHIVFSEQNLLSDPPFSKLHLISCRNVMIYLRPGIQKRLMEVFHFALCASGILVLGEAETIGDQVDLFTPVSQRWHIFQRIDTTRPIRYGFPILPRRGRYNYETLKVPGQDSFIKPQLLVQEAMLQFYGCCSVLINRKHEVIYHHGDTSDYLKFRSGEPTVDLFLLVREGLATKIRAAVHEAMREARTVTVMGARVKREGKFYRVRLAVHPLQQFDGGKGLFLVCFQDEQLDDDSLVLPESEASEEMIRHLEYELHATKQDLQSTIEELETANEELKSSNEELETSKEELQSLNEELNSVNAELQEKVTNLEGSNNDLTNLMTSTQVAAIFLDLDYCIKFFTPACVELFKVIPSDLGRPVSDIVCRFEDDLWLQDAAQVLDDLCMRSKVVCNDQGRWYNRKIGPYRTQDNRIMGVVLVFEDITDLEQTLQELKSSENRYHQLFNHMVSGAAVYQVVGEAEDFVLKDLNLAGEKICKLHKNEVVGKRIREVFPNIDSIQLFQVLQEVWHTGETQHQSPVQYCDERLSCWIKNDVYRLPCGDIVVVFQDLTFFKEIQEDLLHYRKAYEGFTQEQPPDENAS